MGKKGWEGNENIFSYEEGDFGGFPEDSDKDSLEKEVRKFVECSRWIFAKTMPKYPHWYVLRRENPAKEDEFEKFVMFIRKYGYQQKWWKYNHTYYDIDGYKYWTMGAPLKETILINRAKIGDEGN